jgi:hypothetical protein
MPNAKSTVVVLWAFRIGHSPVDSYFILEEWIQKVTETVVVPAITCPSGPRAGRNR